MAYDVQQVCVNGHRITNRAWSFPEDQSQFCAKCGAATILACPECDEPIRGADLDSRVFGLSPPPPPQFCRTCGAAYPWTAARLEAAREMIAELDDLAEEEREKLTQSLDDLAAETPKTELAKNRFKKAMLRGRGATAETLQKIITDVASETIRKTLRLP